MNKYRADIHVLDEQRAVQDNTVRVNSFVAVLDDSDDQNYHVAQVVDITDNLVTLHYLGTRGSRLRSAKWAPLYHSLDGTKLLFYTPNTITRNHRRLLGEIENKAIEDSLIILPNLGFTDHMRLSRDTVDILRRYPDYSHHVYKRT